MQSRPIKEIIDCLRQKDPAIIGELFDAYGATLYKIILRIVYSPELANEVLQDTFVKVWEHGERYDITKGSLFTWLLNIARNTAIDATRTAHFQRFRKMETVNDAKFPPKTSYVQLDYVDLPTHLASLEKKHLILIELFYFKGYTHEEISKEMQIPLGTVKTRLRSALEKLREIYPKGLTFH